MYDADPGRRYPVLYMFDGQNVFFDEDATYGKSWGVADYLDYTDTVSYTHLDVYKRQLYFCRNKAANHDDVLD